MNALLFSAALLSSGVVVTSCKDYDDDINELRDMIGQNTSLSEALQNQLNTLETAAQTAQTTAETAGTTAQTAIQNAQAAQDAADAAQARGDEALAAAQQAQADADSAKADAALAQQAAAQAKIDAINAAKADLDAYKAEVEAALGNKVDNTTFESLKDEVASLGADLQGQLTDLVGRIEGIETGLADEITNALNIRISANEGNIRNLQDALATLAGGATELDVQLATLENYATLLSESGLKKDIADVDQKVEEAKNSITVIQSDIQGIKGQISTAEGNISTIQKYIDETLKPKLQTLDNQIRDINSDLSQLHVLIAARLSSITFAPDYFVDGVEAIVFNSIEYGDMKDYKETQDLVDAILPANFSTAALATASYHFNPASFKLSNADYQYIDRQVEVITTRSAVAATKLLEIEGEPVANVEKGTVEFKLRRLDTPNSSDANAKDKVNTVALQATMKGEALAQLPGEEGETVAETDAVVTSPYVRVYDDVVNQLDLFISDKESLETVGDAAHFATTVTAAQAEDPRYEVIYDKDFDLKTLIATCVNKEDDPSDLHNALALDDYKLSYRFAVAETPYNITTPATGDDETTTNQQTVIQCSDAEEGIYKLNTAEGFVGKESIGRTPILRVDLVDESGRVLRRGFVKVKMVAEKAADLPVGITENIVFGCETTEAEFTLDEEWMRKNVYRVISGSRDGQVSLSHEEFWNMYEEVPELSTMTKNGIPYSGTAPRVIGNESAGVATNKIEWRFEHKDLISDGTGIGINGSTFIGTVVLKNKLEASEYPEYVTFTFAVNVYLPVVAAEFTKNDVLWEGNSYISNVNVPASPTDYADNCKFETKLANAFSSITFDEELSQLPDCYTAYYEVANVYDGDKEISNANGGVYIDGDTAEDQIIKLDKDNEAIKDALNLTPEEIENGNVGLHALVNYVIELESGDKIVVNTFDVRFVTPINLNMPLGKTVVDAKDGGDIVDFNGTQLLTDWRGVPITSPETTEELVETGRWKHLNALHDITVIPGWTEVVSVAKWEIKTRPLTINVPTSVWRGNADVEVIYSNSMTGERQTKSISLSVENCISEADAEAMLKQQLAEKVESNMPSGDGWYWANPNVTIVPAYVETTVNNITIQVIESIEYIPAVVKKHEPKVIVGPHKASFPEREGTQDGEIVGCWEWDAESNMQLVTSYGDYWNFYGPFGELTLDVANATTNLPNGKLPADASLEQVGNTVKYVNVNSPIAHSYEIYIPAYINYGWGTAESTLKLTVNPAGK